MFFVSTHTRKRLMLRLCNRISSSSLGTITTVGNNVERYLNVNKKCTICNFARIWKACPFQVLILIGQMNSYVCIFAKLFRVCQFFQNIYFKLLNPVISIAALQESYTEKSA